MKKQFVNIEISNHLERIFGERYYILPRIIYLFRGLEMVNLSHLLGLLYFNIKHRYDLNDFTYYYQSALVRSIDNISISPSMITLEMLRCYADMKPKIEKIYEYIKPTF